MDEPKVRDDIPADVVAVMHAMLAANQAEKEILDKKDGPLQTTIRVDLGVSIREILRTSELNTPHFLKGVLVPEDQIEQLHMLLVAVDRDLLTGAQAQHYEQLSFKAREAHNQVFPTELLSKLLGKEDKHASQS